MVLKRVVGWVLLLAVMLPVLLVLLLVVSPIQWLCEAWDLALNEETP